MSRKIRTDSIHTQTAMSQAVPPLPPAHVRLRECDVPFWDSIIKSREYSTWHTSDLEVAAQLARCRADIEKLQIQLDGESATIENSAGKLVANPLHQIIETLVKRSTSLAKELRVNTANTVEQEASTNRKRNSLQRKMADRDEFHKDNELLASPTH